MIAAIVAGVILSLVITVLIGGALVTAALIAGYERTEV